jgi:uncharacterized tellurite resistance protein B-like protein
MDFGTPENKDAMNRYIIALLIRQEQADRQISPREEQYLAYVAKELGIADWEIKAIRNDLDVYFAKAPAAEQDRLTILYYLMFMMWADGEVKPEEEILCHHIGFSLGFRPELVYRLVSVMRECLNKQFPPDAMLGVVKAYLN